MAGTTPTSRKRKIVIRLSVAIFLLYGVAGQGCGVTTLPPRPDASQRALLKAPPLGYSVAVVPWSTDSLDVTFHAAGGKSARAYGRNLFERLVATNAFRSVVYDTTGTSDADLLAVSTGEYCNTAIIPLFSILTLGLFPTVFEDQTCEGVRFLAASADLGADSVMVRKHSEERVVMGWVAIPLSLLPGWGTYRTSDRRNGQLLRLEILTQQDDLARLIEK